MIRWLMGWPAGLKLNSELDKFLGELFRWLIQLWTGLSHFIISISILINYFISPQCFYLFNNLGCVVNIEPYTPLIIEVIGLSGMLGASMVVSMLSDFLTFMTIHIYWFYVVAARIYNWQLTILYSLFNLFQGRE